MDRIDRLNDVVSTVGRAFGVSVADMRSNRRTAHVHRPRCIAVYLADRMSGATRTEISAAFNRDEAIVAMYCRAIERLLAQDSTAAEALDQLERRCRRNSDTGSA